MSRDSTTALHPGRQSETLPKITTKNLLHSLWKWQPIFSRTPLCTESSSLSFVCYTSTLNFTLECLHSVFHGLGTMNLRFYPIQKHGFTNTTSKPVFGQTRWLMLVISALWEAKGGAYHLSWQFDTSLTNMEKPHPY